MKRCIVNVACGGWFPRGQERLRNSIKEFNSDIDCLFWKDMLPDGCPNHLVHPYAFKPYALMRAMEFGYDSVLWADASIWATKDLGDLFSFIEKTGYLFFANSYVGLFSSDKCLNYFGINREEAIGMREIMGCCFGLCFKNNSSVIFLKELFQRSMDGITFPGPWNNDNLQASSDTRVKGHRHDQTVSSILAHKFGMKNFITPHETFLCYKCQIPYYYPNEKVPNSVCLLNEGM